MNQNIPHILYKKNDTLKKTLFLHGGCISPKAYTPFLKNLSNTLEVHAMYQRPFWGTEINPNSIKGWDIFKNDTIQFLNQNMLKGSIGIGHSMGAIMILLIEIQSPGTFKKIFLLDPVITSRFRSLIYTILYKLNLIDKFHPMIKITNKKKMFYNNKKELYESYRQKKIFSKVNDENLNYYIDSIIKETQQGINIRIPIKWENTIYRNGSMHDIKIWKKIHHISIPSFVLLPEHNQYGNFHYGAKLSDKNSLFNNLYIKNSTHLFPIENPNKTASLILKNI